MVGIGIRLAQEVGAHRRKPPGNKHTVEDELWNRAFWSLSWSFCDSENLVMLTILMFRALVCIDRAISAAVGRPCAIQEEECVQIAS